MLRRCQTAAMSRGLRFSSSRLVWHTLEARNQTKARFGSSGLGVWFDGKEKSGLWRALVAE